MPYTFTTTDVAYLAGPAAKGALAAVSELPIAGASLIADMTVARRRAGVHAGAVVETVLLRRRAQQRWPIGDIDWREWLFTDEALQQAPPPPVAAHRARRLARYLHDAPTGQGAAGVHDVTCSIGADLAALTAAGVAAVGSDVDPVRLAMARHNLAAAGLPPRLFVADARTVTTHGLVRYADPARRDATGRRITSADTVPSVADLDAAGRGGGCGPLPVLRLPPGIDYDTLGRAGEIEIVSWRGAVREAVSWPQEFATAARRATILGDDGIREEFTDADPTEDSVTPVAQYLIDPDPAVVRAHLVRQYAARHRLNLIDPHLAYLTGARPLSGVRSFEILDSAPYSERVVRNWVRGDDVGTLEIKQRGTPVVPDELRRRVLPRGDRHVERTLVVARIGRGARALWCRALPAGRGPD